MSDRMFNQQTPWEETEEEVTRRINQSKRTRTGWLTTAIGLALAASALMLLLSAS